MMPKHAPQKAAVLTVILNWRTAEMTERAARAALRAMEGVSGALTIVDNDSGDGSYEHLHAAFAAEPRVRVIQSGHNGGFGAGNNVGIRAGLPDGARPDFVYLLNSDAFPDRETIRALRDHLSAHPGIGLAGSRVRGTDGEPHVTAFRFPSVWSEFEGAAHTGPISRLLARYRVPLDPPTQAPAQVDWLAGASLMIRRDVLDRISLFDETFFLYFEETDLCRRAAGAGWPCVYVPSVGVEHIGSASTGMGKWDRVPRYWFDSRWHYFAKHHGTAGAALATLAHVLGAGVWGLRRLVSGAEAKSPPYFLRDLVRHALSMIGRRVLPDSLRGKRRHVAG